MRHQHIVTIVAELLLNSKTNKITAEQQQYFNTSCFLQTISVCDSGGSVLEVRGVARRYTAVCCVEPLKL